MFKTKLFRKNVKRNQREIWSVESEKKEERLLWKDVGDSVPRFIRYLFTICPPYRYISSPPIFIFKNNYDRKSQKEHRDTKILT